ncbi:MAG: carboxymuconolactone decarboxylase family protein [Bryobacterales bacterium]|nr:carboxymuconolactone decarboxylase family protein [Bryobacterales bacterium]
MTPLISDEQASDRVKAVFDDIRKTRNTDYINNLWRAIAVHPPTLERTWERVKTIMGQPSALDPLVKEMIYIAVSVTNNCEYCLATHSAAAVTKGMTPEMMGELLAIVGLANETNRLAIGYRVPIDERFQ